MFYFKQCSNQLPHLALTVVLPALVEIVLLPEASEALRLKTVFYEKCHLKLLVVATLYGYRGYLVY